MERWRALGATSWICFLALVSLSSGTAQGAQLLRFDGIDGESVLAGHEKWIDASDISFGITYATGGSGRGGAAPVFQDVAWSQALDKSAPPLMAAIATGKNIATATVDFVTNPGGGKPETYLEMLFTNVLLSSLQIGSQGQDRATLSGAFSYGKVKMTYNEFDTKGGLKGSLSATYDLKSGAGSAAALAEVFALGAAGPGTPIPAVPEPALGAPLLVALGLLGRHGRRRCSA